jgi:putative membrane protein
MATCAALLPGLSQAREHSAQLSANDKQFIIEAAQGGLAEVKMGEVALQKAKDETVKKLAQHIVKDHNAANEQLMNVAKDLGVKVPADVGVEHQQKIKQLSKMDTTVVDQTYVSQQIKGHQEMISLFQQQLKQGQNEELVAFAKETLPTLKEHLAMAQKLDAADGQPQR